ncbi:MAG: hypothetical protein ABL977_04370 [Candidatus Eisenbacteria bacterium]
MKRIAIVAVVGGLVSVALVLWLLSFDQPEFSEVRRTQRPQGDEFAVNYMVNQGGATVGYGYAVHLQSGRDSAIGKRGPELWNSYKVEPVRVEWAGRDTLTVFVDNNHSYKWSVHEHNRRGIRVRTMWVEPSDSTSIP